MKKRIIFAGLAACWVAQPASAAAPGGCTAAKQALPAVSACVDNANGVALADTAADAAALAELGRLAEARFEKHFGRKAAPYALVTTSAEADVEKLKAIDFKAAYRWETDAQFDEKALASIRANIDKLASERGLPKEQADQFYNQAIDRHSKRMESGERGKTKGATIGRQIGAASLVHAFWPSAAAGSANAAPDWLKEVASALLEDDAAANIKREQFKGGYKGNGDDPITFLMSSDLLANLSDLLTKPRPSLPGATGSGGSIQIMQIRGGGPSPVAANAAYGVQARMFADYMIERTGQATVFGNIAAAMSGGQTLDQWLAGEGAGLGLPASVAALDADWKLWLRKKFGKPG